MRASYPGRFPKDAREPPSSHACFRRMKDLLQWLFLVVLLLGVFTAAFAVTLHVLGV